MYMLHGICPSIPNETFSNVILTLHKIAVVNSSRSSRSIRSSSHIPLGGYKRPICRANGSEFRVLIIPASDCSDCSSMGVDGTVHAMSHARLLKYCQQFTRDVPLCADGTAMYLQMAVPSSGIGESVAGRGMVAF